MSMTCLKRGPSSHRRLSVAMAFPTSETAAPPGTTYQVPVAPFPYGYPPPYNIHGSVVPVHSHPLLSSSRGGRTSQRGGGRVGSAAGRIHTSRPSPSMPPAGQPFWLAAEGAAGVFPAWRTPAGTWTTGDMLPVGTPTLPSGPTNMDTDPTASLPRKQSGPRVVLKISNEEMKKHCLALYSFEGSLHAYVKQNDMSGQRSTLARAMEVSGLKAMKDQGLSVDNRDVHEALDAYLEKRKQRVPRQVGIKRSSARTKRLPAARTTKQPDEPTVRKITRLSNDDMRKHCLALFQWDKSVLSYVNEHDLKGQRSTLSRAFRQSGLGELKAQKERDESLVDQASLDEAQQILDAYLGKRKEFTALEQRRGLSIVELRKHALAFYETEKSLRSYCVEKHILNKRATIARVFAASGLHAMKQQDPPPDVASAREALDMYLKTRRRKRKKPKKKMNFLQDSDLRSHLRALYEIPGTTMRGYCDQMGIERHRGSLRAAWAKSGLKELQESHVHWGPAVTDALDQFFANRRKRQDQRNDPVVGV